MYTGPYLMLLMRANPLRTRASGRGLGPENRDFFGPCEMASSRLSTAIGAQKSPAFHGPIPSHSPS
jgi:hypothetical protein